MMKSVSIAILNYNGQRHLHELLPTVLQAVSAASIFCPVVVLDNCSSDDDAAWLATNFPTVEVAVARRNDFLFSYNWLLERRSEDIVILLNNDLRVSPTFIQPLLRHFAQPDVFAVSATSRDWHDTVFTCGPARLHAHHGQYHWQYETERQELAHTLFASGGFAAVDRCKFVELGGFNTLFRPGYGEDLDVCFRAWRRGWRCIFEPRSLVFHRENGSWGNRRTSNLIERTRLLFQWSSLPSAAPWLERAAFLGLTAARKLLRGQSWWLRVWFSTWLEWCGQRRNHRARKASSAELKSILARMTAPVVLPDE